MSLLNTLDQLSYKKIFSISVFLAVLFTVPVVMALLNQKTRLSSRAAYEKPTIAQEPKATPGPVPVQQPKVGRAWPWVGKEGDIIWVQGWNFGVNPTSKKLVIGGIEVEEADIAAWEDDLIQAIIPEGVKQGGLVEVKVGNHPVSRSLPTIIYDTSVEVRLHKNGNVVYAENASELRRAVVYTGDDEIPTEKHDVDGILPNGSGRATIIDTTGLPILTIILLDENGKVIPYAADPIEFDF